MNIEDIIGKEYKESTDLIDKKEPRGIYNNLPNDIVIKAIDDTSQGSKWSVTRDGSMWTDAPSVANQLTPGVYSPLSTMRGFFLVKKDVQTDKLLKLPDDPTSEVLDHIDDFWNRKDRFDMLGLVFKRGVLLWGPQGSGKTSTMFQLMSKIVTDEGIVILCDDPYECTSAIRLIRSVEKDRRLIVVMEDVDEIIRYYGDKKLTSMLDGDENVNNVVFVATTNYPERLPPRLLRRPSRFDIIKFIGMPTEKARKAYIKHVLKSGVSITELDEWAKNTEEMSIAQIKETIILVKVFDIELIEAIKRVKNLGKIGKPQIEVNLMSAEK